MYETMYIDADTPLFKAAKSVQTDYIVATHKESGWSERFKNKTALWGHHSKKEGGWLAIRNKSYSDDVWLPEDLEVEECAELNTELTDHLEQAMIQFNGFIGKMKRLEFAKDYVLFIGGEGNFRYDSAKLQPYKGQRKDKPLIFHELKMKVIQQYGKRVVLANGVEADDLCGIVGWDNFLNFRKTGIWRDCIAFVDKDLKMICSPSFNYEDKSPEIVIPTVMDCARHFCEQLLSGDQATDNILGLPNFTPAMQEKYEVGRTRGIGAATASRFLRTCESPKELYERVLEAYKDYYGVEKEKLEGFRGESLEWNYLDYIDESAKLLWMRRHLDDDFNIRDRLKAMKIEFEDCS